MARHRRALTFGAIALLAGALVACEKTPVLATRPAASGSSSNVAPSTPEPPASAPPRDAGVPPRANVCPPLKMGEVSDDETPTLRGIGPYTPIAAWFETRGVVKLAAMRWWSGRFGKDEADGFESSQCATLKVGESAEDAIVCSSGSRTELVRARVAVVVVRSKTPAVVLDVALSLTAMDWPDVRHLDLALAFSADGREAMLDDRAPDGTVLVAPPSSCREHQKRLDACERQLADGGTAEPYCPISTRPDGTKYVMSGIANPGSMMYPATLHDCAGAKKTFAELVKGAGKGFVTQARAGAAFIDKACKERGHYVWKGDRFAWSR